MRRLKFVQTTFMILVALLLNVVLLAQSTGNTNYQINLPKVANPAAYNIILKGIGNVTVDEVKGEAKYHIGVFNTLEEAERAEKKINSLGIMRTQILEMNNVTDVVKTNTPPAISNSEIVKTTTSPANSNNGVIKTTINPNNKSANNELPLGVAPSNNSKNVGTSKSNLNPSSPSYKRETEAQRPIVNIPKPEIKKENINKEPLFEKGKAEPYIVVDPNTLEPVKKPETKVINENPTVIEKPIVNEIAKPIVKNTTPNTPAPASNADNTYPVYVAPDRLPETGPFALLLPKVSNPEVYGIVLQDLGTMKSGQLADGRWYYYFGFFKSKEHAKSYISKIKDRGFTKDMFPVKMDIIDTEAKYYLGLQEAAETASSKSNLNTNTPNRPTKVEKAPVNIAGTVYRVELPKADNPEIYLSVFGDIGETKSEIAPNGTGIYYIGAFTSKQEANNNLTAMKDRGLRDGNVITFINDKRQEPFAEYQLKEKEDINTILERKKAEAKIAAAPANPIMPTDPNGRYQIRMAEVENPEVFNNVFVDIGEIKSGAYNDGAPYFYMGNYFARKDAEHVKKQIIERGLTKLSIVDVKSISNDNPNAKIEEPSIWKVKLPGISNPKVYEVVFKDLGIMTNINREYYLGDYNTKEEAYKIQQKVREAGLQTITELIEFKHGAPVE